MAQLMAKEGKYGMVRLPSGELRNVQLNCMASIGQVGNIDHENVNIGKAGRTRHMGIRPTVRGSVMNPCDHPTVVVEGRAPIGRPGPVTPGVSLHWVTRPATSTRPLTSSSSSAATRNNREERRILNYEQKYQKRTFCAA